MHSIRIHSHKSNSGIQTFHLDNHIIGYILHGKLRIYNDKIREIRQGQLFILRAETYQVEYISNDDQPYEEIIIRFSNDTLRRIIHHLPYQQTAQCSFVDTYHTKHLSTHMLKIYFQSIKEYVSMRIFDHNNFMESIKINELIHLILCQPTSITAQNLLQLINCNNAGFVEHIQSSLFRDVTIKQLAQECNMSLSNFKLTFQRQFGCPPHHWVVTHRLHTVCTLLEYTDDPIKIIACECGFSTPSHMIRLFRDRYGTTPTQYRATRNQRLSILNKGVILLK